MNPQDKLSARLEAIKAENADFESRLRANQSEAREIEAALRVINRYSDKKAQFQAKDEVEVKNINITDAILDAVTNAGNIGAASPDIKQHLKTKYGIDVKPSTLSVIIQRHKTKENIAKVGNKWFLASLLHSAA